MTPINFNYVSTFDITVNKDGETQTLTVLSIDKPANESYWKRLNCFSNLINELHLSGPEDAKNWIISKRFAEHPAMTDLAEELLGVPDVKKVKPEDIHMILPEIYSIPVEWTDDDAESCALALTDGTLVVNNYWK